jgi:hypothetical protein
MNPVADLEMPLIKSISFWVDEEVETEDTKLKTESGLAKMNKIVWTKFSKNKIE